MPHRKQENLAWTSELCAMLPDVSIRWFVYDNNPKPMVLPDIAGGCRSLGITRIHAPENVGREVPTAIPNAAPLQPPTFAYANAALWSPTSADE